MAYTARGSTLPVAAEKYVYGSKPGFEMNSRVWVPKKDCGGLLLPSQCRTQQQYMRIACVFAYTKASADYRVCSVLTLLVCNPLLRNRPDFVCRPKLLWR
eukprot:8637-Heterococcus_DN1.PRE.1